MVFFKQKSGVSARSGDFIVVRLSSAIEFAPFANNLAPGVACNQGLKRAVFRELRFWQFSPRTR